MPTSLILLPGLLCDAALWTDQRYELGKERPLRVADLSFGTTVDRLAAQLLRDAPPRFALAGLSMGGYVALAVAAQAPERVAGLALLDTNAHDDPPVATARRRAQIEAARTDTFDQVVAQLLDVMVAPAYRHDRHVATSWESMAHRLGPGAFERQQNAIMTRPDRTMLLPTLTMPALVLCGAEDALTSPEKHEAMAAALPNAELAIIPGAGHLAPLEVPEPVTAALRRWLARVDATA